MLLTLLASSIYMFGVVIPLYLSQDLVSEEAGNTSPKRTNATSSEGARPIRTRRPSPRYLDQNGQLWTVIPLFKSLEWS